MNTATVELDRDELSLLYSLVDRRQMDAEEIGIPDGDPSSVFRSRLRAKLTSAIIRLRLDSNDQ